MKKLTGIDIQLKDFSKSLRGYDTNEVKNFLDEIARQIESLEFENIALKDKLREKELMLMEYKEREGMLKDTMVTAQRVTENIKKDATKEALQIITQAKMRAEAIIREARQNMKKTIDEINNLKKHKMELTSSLRSILETQLRMVTKVEAEKDELIELNIPHNTFSVSSFTDNL
ncbi:MAG: DivIVA domain-containing protein [Proteobacteria bacterium]|nr:DivIVA domain-containing protein [Pseudomonadota bacterium]